MDEIQKVLIKEGRKDLAQKYYMNVRIALNKRDDTRGFGAYPKDSKENTYVVTFYFTHDIQTKNNTNSLEDFLEKTPGFVDFSLKKPAKTQSVFETMIRVNQNITVDEVKKYIEKYKATNCDVYEL